MGFPLIREHWRNPRFWSWWWRARVSSAAKTVVALVAVVAIGFGGFVAADRLGGAVAATPSVETLTAKTVVAVGAGGRVVTRPVRVVRSVTGGTTTEYETRTVLDTITMRGVGVVAGRELRTVPVVGSETVTVVGRPRTVVETHPGQTDTETTTVTNERDVTHEQLVTVTRPVTTTRTVTETVSVTQAQTVHSTVTVTTTMPVTVVETATVPLPVTVTVTVPRVKDD